MKISQKRIKEIIIEEYNNLLGEKYKIGYKEKIPAFAVAKKMITLPYWKKVGKGWEKKVIKKFRSKGVSKYDLEQWLPDYFEGKHIAALFESKLY